MYPLDTNAVINFLNASLSPVAMQSLGNVVDQQCNISVITKMEALGYNFKDIAEQKKMEGFVNGSVILEINNDVVIKTIAIRKSRKIDLPDAIIAATSIAYNLILITRNSSDFRNIQGLQVIDPDNL
jgi:toxin FitB